MAKKFQSRPRCQFCGGENPISDEHVFPKWIGKLLPPAPSERSHVKTSLRRALNPKTRTEITDAIVHRKMAGPAQSRTVRRFCVDCNNGWMGRLEEKAMPVLTPLICGDQPTLSAENLLAIARWAGLKAIVGEYTVEASRCISDSQRDLFFKTQTVSEGWTVELAANAQFSSPKYWHNHWYPATSTFAPFADSTQTTALFIGHLFIYFRSTTALDRSGRVHSYKPFPELTRIWPQPCTEIDWKEQFPTPPWRLEVIADSLRNARVSIDGEALPRR